MILCGLCGSFAEFPRNKRREIEANGKRLTRNSQQLNRIKEGFSKLYKKRAMGSLVVTSKMLNKYFGFLRDLDNKAKKMLINKLTGSMKEKPKKDFELGSLFGAWEDSRDSEEIIEEIRAARVEKSNTEGLG